MIETFLGMAKYLSPREDDDWSDRLNYLITPNILLAFSVLISFKQFGGRPIECMFPNKFPGSWEQYAENYCWSQDTYFVEPKQHVELIKAESRYTPERQLSYYQWVPFFLLLQAAFFRAPSYIWKYFSDHSGLRIHEVVEKARDVANVEEEVKEKNINILVRHLKNALRFQRRLQKKKVVVHKTVTCLNYQYSSGFISTVYLFTKLVYLVNTVGQLWMMNYFLGTDKYNWYGLGVVQDIIQGVQWDRSGFFPRAAVCDFEVRQVANIQKYSVQCVLVINIFNEKIFILLWFWYLILMVASLVSFLQWFVLLAFPCFSRWFIAQHLELSSLSNFIPSSSKGERDVTKFVHGYLHRDGVFVLRMVSGHAGVLFATDLVLALWKAFYGIEEKALESEITSIDEPPTISTDSVRRRKKKSFVDFLNGEDFQTSLVPDKDDRNDSDESSTPPRSEVRLSGNV